MKAAIISDIHANLESLNVFKNAFADKYNYDRIICLGDMIDYNVSPNETIQITSELLHAYIISGNHEEAFFNKDIGLFNYNAASVAKWTAKQLSAQSINMLKQISRETQIYEQLFAVCHGEPGNTTIYIDSVYKTAETFKWLKKRGLNVLFNGHTHIPAVYEYNTKTGQKTKLIPADMRLNSDNLYIINPGSIGLPRGKNSMASFVEFDTERLSVKFVRYDYPVMVSVNKILKSSMPAKELYASLLLKYSDIN